MRKKLYVEFCFCPVGFCEGEDHGDVGRIVLQGMYKDYLDASSAIRLMYDAIETSGASNIVILINDEETSLNDDLEQLLENEFKEDLMVYWVNLDTLDIYTKMAEYDATHGELYYPEFCTDELMPFFDETEAKECVASIREWANITIDFLENLYKDSSEYPNKNPLTYFGYAKVVHPMLKYSDRQLEGSPWELMYE